MQASKIIPHTVYAIMHNDKLVRFQVKKVITTQTRTNVRSGPHDYVSVVIGMIDEPGHSGAVQVSPEAVLGIFTEYAELQARHQAEKAAKAKSDAEAEALRAELCDLFYELSRLPLPSDPDRKAFSRVFRQSYFSVEIRQEAIEPLLKALRGIARLKVVA